MSNPGLEGISENYYQIGEAVLSSFPKYRFPVDLYLLQEDVVQLIPYYKKENRISNEQQEEIQKYCKEGLLFVARSDHPIYSQHIVKQLDLVLLDQNLKEAEAADIFIRALTIKLNDFFDQPVKPVFDQLHEDCLVFTEYLWNDHHKIRLFMRRLNKGTHSLAAHTLNTLVVGLWLLIHLKGKELTRKELDLYAIAFLLHDAGMTKVPPFVLSKTTPLKPEERDKIPNHVLAGTQIIQKMEMIYDEVKLACLEHHERLDGSGYPQKANSAKMSYVGSLCAVADSFAAMIQKRNYADAKEPLAAAKELMEDMRYDRTFSSTLYTALVTNAFGQPI